MGMVSQRSSLKSPLQSHPEQDATDRLALQADGALARRAAQGDREAFQEIVQSHKQRMFTVARSVIRDAALAEDIVQEAFIKAYRALPEFRGDSKLSTWLYRITYLTAIDMQRQQVRHLQLANALHCRDVGGPETDRTETSEHGEAALRTSQLRREIDLALTNLSPFEQTVFTLRHLQNFKLKEIAVVVDRSEGTMKNILFRAIHKMREQLTHVAPDLIEPGFMEIKIMEIKTC